MAMRNFLPPRGLHSLTGFVARLRRKEKLQRAIVPSAVIAWGGGYFLAIFAVCVVEGSFADALG
jgi:hypothetical protein